MNKDPIRSWLLTVLILSVLIVLLDVLIVLAVHNKMKQVEVCSVGVQQPSIAVWERAYPVPEPTYDF